MSRQYFYKHLKEKREISEKKQQVLTLIHNESKVLPRLGGKKIYHQISTQISCLALKFGSDKVFALLR